MAAEGSERERPFKVQDRRRFSETGEARAEAADRAEPPPAAEAPEGAREGGTAESEAAAEINFATFVISLSTQALAHLGEIPHPVDQSTNVDLVAARQVIDILGMLRDKTKGNLDAAENSLLENALYDLRMKYVERVRGR